MAPSETGRGMEHRLESHGRDGHGTHSLPHPRPSRDSLPISLRWPLVL